MNSSLLPLFTVGSLSFLLSLVAGCADSPGGAAGDGGGGDGSTGSADAGADVDSGKADSGLACGQEVCATSSKCQSVPYDHCGPIEGVCSCAITCIEIDGGTNCAGGSPCKTSAEGTKYCSATHAN